MFELPGEIDANAESVWLQECTPELGNCPNCQNESCIYYENESKD